MSATRLSDRSRPWVVSALVFLLCGVLASELVRHSEETRVALERARVADLIRADAHALERQIQQALSAVYALAALVRQGEGSVGDFDSAARELLPYYRGATSLRLAPAGIVRYIYPMAGNEGALGLDLLRDSERAPEVRLALATGRLTLAGPYQLAGGGFGAVGRLPVFLGEGRDFWGFAIVSLRFPDVLQVGRLPVLAERGLGYRLWRTNPATQEIQVIDASGAVDLVDPVDQAVELPNATWTLSAAPRGGWTDPYALAWRVGMAAVFSALAAGLVALLVETQGQRRRLAALVAERTAQVAAREADLHRAQAVAHVGSWSLDLRTGELSRSAEADRVLGLKASGRGLYRDFLARVLPEDRPSVIGARKAVMLGDGHDIEYRIRVGVESRWVRARAEPVLDAQGRPIRCLGTLQDITERRRAEAEIRQLAFYDPLTGLANRRLLLDRMQQALARCARSRRRCALLYIDLDRFKAINDTLGHDAGDVLLREVGARLASCVRRADTLARLGGDELVVMLEDLGVDSAEAVSRVADKVRGALLLPFRLGGQQVRITASIGIALFGDRPEAPEEVLRRADRAMYGAKAEGGNALSFAEAATQSPGRRGRSVRSSFLRLPRLKAGSGATPPGTDRNPHGSGADRSSRRASPRKKSR